ncbi:hypothetical protein SeMB42_g03417 [Synchytrium endobioticum]|uniref:Uncharacterized protein n=1 Tax=Synchytrium endobioticum TaxID=286115 RepID=A0A507D6E7_9FUNG|nr:hypothetical protein SeMB42_g03417 [Synchytrium endobioticum]
MLCCKAQRQPNEPAHLQAANAKADQPVNDQGTVLTGGPGDHCWGEPPTLQVGFDVKYNGSHPAAETGLPFLVVCASMGGSPVNLECSGGWNFENKGSVIVNGANCAQMQTQDDQSNIGCHTHVTPVNNGTAKLDCAQITLSVTSSLNGTEVPTVLIPKNGKTGTTAQSALPPAALPTNAAALSPNATVTVTLPLQPPERCNPAQGDATKSVKRLGFMGVTVESSATKGAHQPMDDSPEGLVHVECAFTVPMLEVSGVSALDTPSVSSGKFAYNMIDDGPNQVWHGAFQTPCDTKTGKEETEIKITGCTCTSKVGPCVANIK